MNVDLPYKIDYARVSFKCKQCKAPIQVGELQIGERVQAKRHDRKNLFWSHKDCVVKAGMLKSSGEIENFEGIKYDDQLVVLTDLTQIVGSSSIAGDPKDSLLESKIAEQTERLLEARQILQKTCKKNELEEFLTLNQSSLVEGFEKLLDRCADFLAFGALFKCKKCSNGDMIFVKGGYACNAMINEWVKCGNFGTRPMRFKCSIPETFKRETYFENFNQFLQNRAVRKVESGYRRAINGSKNSDQSKPSAPQKVEIKLKGGTVVNPKSKLDRISHVYRYKGVLYSSVLGLTDIEKDKNSYFKLEVLESDAADSAGKRDYWLFTDWGRIGTDIGDSRTEKFEEAKLACEKFKKLFEERTGNDWNTKKDSFKKISGKFYPIDVNYKDDLRPNTSVASKLSPKVEELIKLLFDVKTMTKTMKTFQLDLDKMPLGKLSIKPLEAALNTLNELEDMVREKDLNAIVGLSEKFFTLIPHNFGLGTVPVINTMEKIKSKRETVESLFEIEKAYSMMLKGHGDKNSYDGYFKQLKAYIHEVDPKSKGYELIEIFVQNTSMHGFKLEILEVFKVNRYGEKKRYQPFKNSSNRMLLWHGSRITNFASIISDGLKIGAPANGSMFGRGIYFADIVSKSAQYCHQTDKIGLLALSEVALGKIHKLQQAEKFTQAPAGFDSVKGLGQTCPDPQKAHTRKDGVIIPLGEPIANPSASGGALKFNEYVVYDEAQVNIQYLVKVKFVVSTVPPKTVPHQCIVQ